MADLRERLAAFHDEAERVFVALQEQGWEGRLVIQQVRTLRGDLDDVIRDLSNLIGNEEAWTEEE